MTIIRSILLVLMTLSVVACGDAAPATPETPAPTEPNPEDPNPEPGPETPAPEPLPETPGSTNSRLLSSTTQGGQTAYSYDPKGRLTSIVGEGSSTTYTYNSAGLIDTLTTTDESGTTKDTFEYDAVGQVTKGTVEDSGPDGLYLASTVTFEYTSGRVESGLIEVINILEDDKVVSVADGEPDFKITYTYDQGGNLSATSLATLDGTTVSASSYTYTAAGQLKTLEEEFMGLGSSITSYEYDMRGGWASESYEAFDPNGQLVDKESTSFVYETGTCQPISPNPITLVSLGTNSSVPCR